METFDQNVDHITKWIIQADALLDESEKKKPQQKEDMLKVANKLLQLVMFTLHNSYINHLCPKRYQAHTSSVDDTIFLMQTNFDPGNNNHT